MAKSKYEYVKEFENHERCLPNCWIVVRVDGKGFSKFSDYHRLEKPNDLRLINLMNTAAEHIIEEFPEVILAYGQSDEYSFVLKKTTNLFNRRVQKLVSVFASAFTAYFITNWNKFFPMVTLSATPIFDARVVTYPSNDNLRDYLSWRQADAHINNLYNTCFWNLVLKKNLTPGEAQEKLKGTVSSDKNEILHSEFGINYNDEPEVFKKGTVIIRINSKNVGTYHIDIIRNNFWEEHSHLLQAFENK